MFLKWSHDGSGVLRPDQRARTRSSSTSTAYETDGYARTLIYQDDVGYQVGDISE